MGPFVGPKPARAAGRLGPSGAVSNRTANPFAKALFSARTESSVLDDQNLDRAENRIPRVRKWPWRASYASPSVTRTERGYRSVSEDGWGHGEGTQRHGATWQEYRWRQHPMALLPY